MSAASAAAPITYADAHTLYRRAGWTGPLPLPAGAKWPPPDGFTGWHGAYPSGADSQAWVDDYPEYRTTRQLALRMPDDVIGIDVDHYGAKRGADTMAEAVRRWAELPIAPRSSARGDGPSGIYFYRVPRGAVLKTRIGFPELGLGDVEVVQRHHRYAVVWPSVHPEGGQYRWYEAVPMIEGAVPSVRELPALPPTWLQGLAGVDEPGEAAADPTTVAEFARRYCAGGNLSAIRGVLSVFSRDAETGSRHDAMLSAVCMGAREARMGRFPAATIRGRLRDAFALALAEAKPGQRLAGPPESRREFDSMWAWGVSQALALDDDELARRRERADPPAGAAASGSGSPSVAAEPSSELDESGAERSSWQPIDLGPILRGEVEPAQPTVGIVRSDGNVRLLYPGKEHAVIGEMESGKSWLALACVQAELEQGHTVIYVHFEEDDATDTVTRLQLLGVEKHVIDERFLFIAPTYGITPDVVDRLLEYAPSLVVLDGQNEAMSLHGHGINDPDGVAAYRRMLVRPFTAAGAAVLSTDHVTKSAEGNRAGYAMGSIHKGNGLTGTLILLESEEAMGKGRRGASRVFVTKDRPAQVRQHGRAGDTPRKFFMGMLIVDATVKPDERVDLSFYAPSDAASPSPFELVSAWHDVLSDESTVPGEVAGLRDATGGRKGADAARDIFRVLRYVDDPDGLTTAQIRKAVAEGPREYSDSVFFAGRSMLVKAGVCNPGSTPARIALAPRFVITR